MIGLEAGRPPAYLMALALIVPVSAVAALLLNVIPSDVLHGHSKNIGVAPLRRHLNASGRKPGKVSSCAENEAAVSGGRTARAVLVPSGAF
jgi:hypothetical protein